VPANAAPYNRRFYRCDVLTRGPAFWGTYDAMQYFIVSHWRAEMSDSQIERPSSGPRSTPITRYGNLIGVTLSVAFALLPHRRRPTWTAIPERRRSHRRTTLYRGGVTTAPLGPTTCSSAPVRPVRTSGASQLSVRLRRNGMSSAGRAPRNLTSSNFAIKLRPRGRSFYFGKARAARSTTILWVVFVGVVAGFHGSGQYPHQCPFPFRPHSN
jgi:hypothetical protein